MPEQLIIGIDIGTTKLSAAVALSNGAGGTRYIGHRNVPVGRPFASNADDRSAFDEAMQRILDEAASLSGAKVHDIVVSLAGAELTGIDRHARISIDNGYPIYLPDIERALAGALIEYQPSSTTIHRVVQGFAVNGEPTRDPIGRMGERLEVWTREFVVSRDLAEGIQRAFARFGVRVHALVPVGVASGEAALRPDERERGVILVDIGGATTDVALFVDGHLYDLSGIHIGGDHIVRDIAVILGIPFERAENYMTVHGASLKGPGDYLGVEWSPRGIAVMQNKARGGSLSREIPRAIAGARIEQIMTEVRDFARKSAPNLHFHAGVVITGGASQVPGIVEVTAELLNMPVRRGDVLQRGGFPAVADPSVSASIGLVRYCANRSANERVVPQQLPKRVLDTPFESSAVVSYESDRVGLLRSLSRVRSRRQLGQSRPVSEFMRQWMRELIPARSEV